MFSQLVVLFKQRTSRSKQLFHQSNGSQAEVSACQHCGDTSSVLCKPFAEAEFMWMKVSKGKIQSRIYYRDIYTKTAQQVLACWS